MANIKKIQVNGVEYEVYDEAAHRLINRVRNEMPADLTENAQGRIILIDENGNPIGEGVSVSAKVDDLILEQEGDENKLFLAYQGETIGEGVVLPATGGGGSSTTSTVRVVNNNGVNAMSVAAGNDVVLKFTFTSVENDIPTGNGTCKILVNGAVKTTFSVENGAANEVNVKDLLIAGTNTVKVTCIDVYGNSRSLTYTITVADLSITSDFDDTVVYNSGFEFRYTPYGVGISKTIHFILDGTSYETVTTTLSGRESAIELPAMSHGIHTFEVYSVATMDGQTLESNHLKYEIMCSATGNATPIIALDNVVESATQGEMVSIEYSVYNPAKLACDIALNIYNADGTVYSTQEITVDRSRQTWNTRKYPVGKVKFEVSYASGENTYTRYKEITVAESDIDVAAATTGLELFLSSAGRSNNEADPAVWTDGDTTTTFANVNWNSSGWVEDEEGDVALRLSGDATAEISFQPFASDFKANGKTIEFEFAVRDVNNREAEVISCMNGGVGLSITADRAVLNSAMSSVECRFKDEEKIRVGFVVETSGEDRLLLVYLNGILSSAMQYAEKDIFKQDTPVTISVGSPYCSIDLYTIRVYANSLTSAEMVNNYIADTTDIVKKTELYEANNIYENGIISYEIMKKKIPVVTIIGTLPTSKGDKKDVTFIYENPENPALNFTDACSFDVQGTSSQYYVRKNYKAKFSAPHTHAVGQLPAQVFCLKADYAEGTGTHNTQNANLVETLYDELVPPQEDDARCRTTIYGFPCVVFHQATENDTPVFIGKYNFNYDKGAENVFGFSGSNAECWEFKNNTSDACNFLGAVPSDWSDDFEARYPDKSTNITRFKQMHNWVVSTCQANATGATLASSYTDVDGNKHTVDNAAYRLAKFKTEFEQWFDMHYTAVYYTYTFFALMVDQRAKNMFLTYWAEKGKWFPYFYDNDTSFGINNEGHLTFDYYHEDTDKVDSANVYNGQNSTLWVNFREAFPDVIQECYQTIRNDGKLTYDILVDRFITQGADKWPAAIYNEDSEYKYISMLRSDDDAENLYQVKGSGEEHFKYFIENRLDYCDSKWYASDYADDIVSLRIYTPETYAGVTPNADITVTPYSNMYCGVRYGAGGTLKQEKATKNVPVTFEAPNNTFNDTETAIYGASNISSLGDLSPLYCGTLNVSKADKLVELIVGSNATGYVNQNMKELSVGNNKLLQKINIQNCVNLVDPLNLSLCPNIEEIYAEGSGITGVSLPKSGYLKKMYLPATIVDLTIQNQASLADFTMAGYNALKTMTIENCPTVDAIAIAYAAPNLTNVRLTGLNLHWETIDDEFIEFFANIGGIDDEGDLTDTAIISGTCYIEELTGEQYARVQEVFPYLDITYGKLTSVITYMNETGTTKLYEETIYNGGSASNPVTDNDISAPTKASTAQYEYTFSGWSTTPGGSASASALTNINANRTVYAAFTSTVRSYTVTFKNDDGSTLHTETVRYGGNATYSTTPTSSQGADYEFKGWSPSPTNITGNLTCTAQYKSPASALDGMTWAEIAEISAAGTAANYFDVGDCKAVDLKGTVGSLALDTTLYVYVLGIDHNKDLEGAGVTFGGFRTASDGGIDVALIDANYNSSKTDGTKTFNVQHWGYNNYGGWAGCDMRYDILGSTDVQPSGYGANAASGRTGNNPSATCTSNPVANTLMAALPADLRAVLKPITKYTDNVAGGSGNVEANVTATIDYLPLLAEYEIFGSKTYANDYEKNKQAQYAYYAAGNSKKKYRHSATGSACSWWERSPRYSNDLYFCSVDTSGYALRYSAHYSSGLAPAFLV